MQASRFIPVLRLSREERVWGATVACAWLIGQRLYTATVGDSRIYLIRQGKIHQVSTDHSLDTGGD